MKLLAELSDKDINNGGVERFNKPYTLRKATRAVLFNDKNEIAFQFVSKHNYHKLPGGGINEGENIIEGLKREVREETGCEDLEIVKELGVIVEYRNKIDILQISYCYLAKVKGSISAPQWDTEEIKDKHQSLWLPIDKAIEFLKSDKTNDYQGQFIIKRDLIFLEEALKKSDN